MEAETGKPNQPLSVAKVVSIVVAVLAVVSVVSLGVWYAVKTESEPVSPISEELLKSKTVAESPLSQEPSAKDDLLIEALQKPELEGTEQEQQQAFQGSKAETSASSGSSTAGSTQATATGSASPSAKLDLPDPVAKKNPLLALRDLVMSSRRNMIIAAVSTVLVLLILVTVVVAIVLLTAEEPVPEVAELDMTPRGVASRWYEETFGDAKFKTSLWTIGAFLGSAAILYLLIRFNLTSFNNSSLQTIRRIAAGATCGIALVLCMLAGFSYLVSFVSAAYVNHVDHFRGADAWRQVANGLSTRTQLSPFRWGHYIRRLQDVQVHQKVVEKNEKKGLRV